MEDKRALLREERPFSYKIIKDEKAIIYWKDKQIMVIKGKEYQRLSKTILENNEYKKQLFLAKITGHFKHGNEK